ncbi:hypothetical protein RND71_040672 [Anisodus tanguticus]|uniref:Uncharacterized protein n=1 Tax=Anisodus tanguticus TaxID=243964 RepID=A0AAE1QTE1_9SOLA|nr:hypothetical protein RND71_040672 [Anisodus tanguticus]
MDRKLPKYSMDFGMPPIKLLSLKIKTLNSGQFIQQSGISSDKSFPSRFKISNL